MVEVSKSKSVNKYLEFKNMLNHKTKGHCLMVCETRVLFATPCKCLGIVFNSRLTWGNE